MFEITQAQDDYIRQRGFLPIYDGLDHEPNYPYLLLDTRLTTIADSPVELHLTEDVKEEPIGLRWHPNMIQDELTLAERVAWLVGSMVDEDGVLFSTDPGVPIPIYVEDPAWKPVVEILERAYNGHD